MTIAMPDSITPTNIPLGYPAVLGYEDGEWPTAEQLPALFPKARHLILTVTGATTSADGVDCEKGDLGAASAAAWVKRKLAVAPLSRPVVYADLETPGYSMPEVIAAMLKLGVHRPDVRLLPPHYTGDAHVCSPATCKTGDGRPIAWLADGTQWTAKYPGLHGSAIDMSLLDDSFFGDWIFSAPRSLTVLGAGPHSVKASWDAPGTAAPEAVHHYQLTVRYLGQDVGKPVDIPKGANPQIWQWDNLKPGTSYELMVRALAADGHASPWATEDFKTSG